MGRGGHNERCGYNIKAKGIQGGNSDTKQQKTITQDCFLKLRRVS